MFTFGVKIVEYVIGVSGKLWRRIPRICCLLCKINAIYRKLIISRVCYFGLCSVDVIEEIPYTFYICIFICFFLQLLLFANIDKTLDFIGLIAGFGMRSVPIRLRVLLGIDLIFSVVFSLGMFNKSIS